MTYQCKPIDFCDHVGHGLCGNCPDDPPTVDDVSIPVDEGTYRRLAAIADASGTTVDEAAERALSNLLAVIHRDGGHYVEEHGLTMASKDAEVVVIECRSALRELLDAFPHLGKGYSTDEQQLALRRARKAVGR